MGIVQVSVQCDSEKYFERIVIDVSESIIGYILRVNFLFLCYKVNVGIGCILWIRNEYEKR